VTTPRIGLSAAPQLPPRSIPDFARSAEDAGFDEVWFAEDCFFAGGIAAASAALAATRAISVGMGILPAVARNAAFVAMEVAALAELYPGRVTLGLGHGMAGWMRQIGALPRSPLTALGEHLDAVRALLAGRTVNVQGDYVRLDGVRLDHPPGTAPPVLAGVRGPRSLELSGARADGTMLAWPAAAAYVRDARSRIDVGRASAGRTDRHVIVVGTPIFLDSDVAKAQRTARASLAAELAGSTSRAHLEPVGLADDAAALIAASVSPDELAARLPTEWVDELAIAGDPAHCAARITALHHSGADTVVVGLNPDVNDTACRDLLAALR
jgi:alkanesulfonate monooxygenase SsuD/methylene tetrahydromethanopterin reductase-like flavin-dependent oxidoreductase (luciferase family)